VGRLVMAWPRPTNEAGRCPRQVNHKHRFALGPPCLTLLCMSTTKLVRTAMQPQSNFATLAIVSRVDHHHVPSLVLSLLLILFLFVFSLLNTRSSTPISIFIIHSKLLRYFKNLGKSKYL
jgi:hypothetical protein